MRNNNSFDSNLSIERERNQSLTLYENAQRTHWREFWFTYFKTLLYVYFSFVGKPRLLIYTCNQQLVDEACNWKENIVIS